MKMTREEIRSVIHVRYLFGILTLTLTWCLNLSRLACSVCVHQSASVGAHQMYTTYPSTAQV